MILRISQWEACHSNLIPTTASPGLFNYGSSQLQTAVHAASFMTIGDDMDVAYTKSGASSRAHYQIVRNVENAPEESEQLLANEVQRVRQRMTSKNLSAVSIPEAHHCEEGRS